MQGWILGLILLAGIWSDLVANPIPVEILADDRYPPYAYEESGKPAGIYYDILREVFDRMPKYNITIRAINWKRGLAKIRRGESFAIYPPYFHPDERPFMWPYSYPILEEKVVVVCHRDKFKNRKPGIWPDDYTDLSFGLNAGFQLGGKRFWALVNDGKVQVTVAKGNRANILKLVRQRIDCYINDHIAIYYTINQLITSGELTIQKAGVLSEEIIVSRENGYLGYSSTATDFPYKDKFAKQFNSELAKMVHSGEVERIIQRYIQYQRK